MVPVLACACIFKQALKLSAQLVEVSPLLFLLFKRLEIISCKEENSAKMELKLRKQAGILICLYLMPSMQDGNMQDTFEFSHFPKSTKYALFQLSSYSKNCKLATPTGNPGGQLLIIISGASGQMGLGSYSFLHCFSVLIFFVLKRDLWMNLEFKKMKEARQSRGRCWAHISTTTI